jgi:hypothetical protein
MEEKYHTCAINLIHYGNTMLQETCNDTNNTQEMLKACIYNYRRYSLLLKLKDRPFCQPFMVHGGFIN